MQWRQSRRGADTASRGSYEVRLEVLPVNLQGSGAASKWPLEFGLLKPRLSVSAHDKRASRTSVRAGRGERGDASDRTGVLP